MSTVDWAAIGDVVVMGMAVIIIGLVALTLLAKCVESLVIGFREAAREEDAARLRALRDELDGLDDEEIGCEPGWAKRRGIASARRER